MNYFKQYPLLKRIKSFPDSEEAIKANFEFIDVNFDSVRSIDFSYNLADSKNTIFNALLSYYLQNNSASNNYIFRNLNAPDNNFEENNKFSYTVLKNKKTIKSNSVIVLLHGLNEKNWDKYLPWAYHLMEKTGKPVILFPLAFHMNRAPKEWSDSRLMFRLSQERMLLFPSLESSSYVNAALSTRLQFSPERFLLSGLQTLYDIIQLVEEIREDKNPYISKDASIDYFGYSIGGFLGQILIMSNPHNLFADSRFLVFCGGATLDKTTPISRTIIDSEAADGLIQYYLDHFENAVNKDGHLHDLFAKSEEVGVVFKSMLDSTKMVSFRNALLSSLKEKIRIVGLGKDKVFTPASITGDYLSRIRDSVKVFDFNYNYTHETPFPLLTKIEEEVNNAFIDIFNYSAEFLG